MSAREIDTTGFIFPLSTLDEVTEELENTNRALLRLTEIPVMDLDRRAQRKERLLWWRSRLTFQQDRMVEQGCTLNEGRMSDD